MKRPLREHLLFAHWCVGPGGPGSSRVRVESRAERRFSERHGLREVRLGRLRMPETVPGDWGRNQDRKRFSRAAGPLQGGAAVWALVTRRRGFH